LLKGIPSEDLKKIVSLKDTAQRILKKIALLKDSASEGFEKDCFA
jgi:hypothetical protein